MDLNKKKNKLTMPKYCLHCWSRPASLNIKDIKVPVVQNGIKVVEYNESSEHDNKVFDTFMKSFKSEQPLIDRQHIFRKKYASFLVWLSKLEKNRTRRKIMATVNKYRRYGRLYGNEEGIRLAVDERRFLLNRMFEDPLASNHRPL